MQTRVNAGSQDVQEMLPNMRYVTVTIDQTVSLGVR